MLLDRTVSSPTSDIALKELSNLQKLTRSSEENFHSINSGHFCERFLFSLFLFESTLKYYPEEGRGKDERQASL